MNMGDRIKEMRKLRGFTQEELAQKLGLKDSAIAKYESGRVENIKRNVIAEMAKVLDCSPVYLLCLDEDAPPPNPETDFCFSLSDEEKHLILKYRDLAQEDKNMINRILEYSSQLSGSHKDK